MWGQNVFGKLGLGDYQTRHTPEQVFLLNHIKVTQVATGGNHSAVLDSDGHVYLFGYGSSSSDKVKVNNIGEYERLETDENDQFLNNNENISENLKASLVKSVSRPRIVSR